jgi:hypothetical protein
VDERSNNANMDGAAAGPEPHGHAALLLVESLIHGLIANSSLTVEQAVEIVEIAAQVKHDTADAVGDTPTTLQRSLHLLESISASLRQDLPAT